MNLKSELKKILSDQPTHIIDNETLIEKMLANIGSVDPELRDELIFSTFGKLIIEERLTHKQLEYILQKCLNKLFVDIGTAEGDSVFARSFSALTIALILEKDREKQLLSDDLVERAIDSSINYLRLEKDIRGYVQGKGWAHSVAHGADLLAEAIKHPYFNTELSHESLEVIKLCLFKESSSMVPYVDDEEERLIFVTEALMEKGTSQEDIEHWVSEISNELKFHLEREGFGLSFFRKRSDVINFLRAFYFRLLFKNEKPSLQKLIAEVLEKWHNQLFNPKSEQ
ncbi:DUF2785 domain-containing protein [Halalkalibacillus sediminis]|nr:DUF2785 domain-containing protein [Halalkalibacillus sediminis]